MYRQKECGGIITWILLGIRAINVQITDSSHRSQKSLSERYDIQSDHVYYVRFGRYQFWPLYCLYTVTIFHICSQLSQATASMITTSQTNKLLNRCHKGQLISSRVTTHIKYSRMLELYIRMESPLIFSAPCSELTDPTYRYLRNWAPFFTLWFCEFPHARSVKCICWAPVI